MSVSFCDLIKHKKKKEKARTITSLTSLASSIPYLSTSQFDLTAFSWYNLPVEPVNLSSVTSGQSPVQDTWGLCQPLTWQSVLSQRHLLPKSDQSEENNRKFRECFTHVQNPKPVITKWRIRLLRIIKSAPSLSALNHQSDTIRHYVGFTLFLLLQPQLTRL